MSQILCLLFLTCGTLLVAGLPHPQYYGGGGGDQSGGAGQAPPPVPAAPQPPAPVAAAPPPPAVAAPPPQTAPSYSSSSSSSSGGSGAPTGPSSSSGGGGGGGGGGSLQVQCKSQENPPGSGNFKFACDGVDPSQIALRSEHILWLEGPAGQKQVVDVDIPNYKIEELIKAGFKTQPGQGTQVNIKLRKPEQSYEAQKQDASFQQGTPTVNLQYEPVQKTVAHFPSDKPYSPLQGPLLPPGGGSGSSGSAPGSGGPAPGSGGPAPGSGVAYAPAPGNGGSSSGGGAGAYSQGSRYQRQTYRAGNNQHYVSKF